MADDKQPMTIWSKVNYGLVAASNDAASTERTSNEEWDRAKRRWRKWRVVLDVYAALFWLYLVTKLFVVDLDQKIVEKVDPDAQWILDYRFFIVLGAFAITALVARKLRYLALILAYVALFPVVVVVWKLPRLLYRTKSWVATIAAVNAASALLTHLKYAIVFSAVVMIAGLAIIVAEAPPVLYAAAIVIAMALGLSIARTIRSSLSPSRFLTNQQRAVQRLVGSEFRKNATALSEELRSAEIEQFNPAQQQNLIQQLSNAVLFQRMIYFWAYQLEEYRKSAGSVFFSTFSYVWLLVQGVAALTFINFAAYKVDPANYSFSTDPSWPVVIRYSFTSFYGNEISALAPASDLANMISVFALVIGVVMITTLFLTWFVNYRHSRDQTAIKEVVDEMRREGEKLNAQIEKDFQITSSEAIQRLQELGAVFARLILFFSVRVPRDFEDRDLG